jgi:hypothetical protein
MLKKNLHYFVPIQRLLWMESQIGAAGSSRSRGYQLGMDEGYLLFKRVFTGDGGAVV